jgi:(2Fe-2S) ferredoxin
MNGSVAFREHLKKTVKERGLKGQVMITGTSCLDFCPAQGCTIAIYPDNEWAIVDISPESEEAVLARALGGPPVSEG